MGYSNQGEGTCVYQDEIQELFPKQRIQKSTLLNFQLYLFVYLIIRQNLEGFMYVIASDEVLYIHRQRLYSSPNSDLCGIL